MGEITNEKDKEKHWNRNMGEAKDEAEEKISWELSRKKWCRPSFKLRSESLNLLRLRRVFDLFDKNGDGVISMDEIRQALERLGLDGEEGEGEGDDELKDLVTTFIRPGNQGLGFEDFQYLHNSLNTKLFFKDHVGDDQVESDLTEAFKVFDSDGDGFISATELQQVLSKLGFPEAQQELHHIQHMISSFDRNHDGRVDFLEFKHMMSPSLLP